MITHKQWVRQQFFEYPPNSKKRIFPNYSYRNALVHASIIEGVIKRELVECGHLQKNDKQPFGVVLKLLEKNNDQLDYDLLRKVKCLRNEMLHAPFVQKYNSEIIDSLRDDLIDAIKKAYKESKFLHKHYLDYYGINLLEVNYSCYLRKTEYYQKS